jgi:hypothetical protein
MYRSLQCCNVTVRKYFFIRTLYCDSRKDLFTKMLYGE